MTVDSACHRLQHRASRSRFINCGPPAAAARTFAASGPDMPGFALLALEIEELMAPAGLPPARLRGLLDRLSTLVLTQKGEPRKRPLHPKAEFRSPGDYERHKAIVLGLGPHVQAATDVFRKDLNLVLARGVRRLRDWQDEYRRTRQARRLTPIRSSARYPRPDGGIHAAATESTSTLVDEFRTPAAHSGGWCGAGARVGPAKV
jgi:hypothetical protein